MQCIFYKKDKQEEFFKIKQGSFPYALRMCKNCHAYMLFPRPTTEQLDEAYSTGYYGGGESKFNPIIEFVVNLFRSIRASRAVKGIPERAKLLDIGCVSGAFLNFLHKKYNFTLSGLEIEGDAALRAADQNKGFRLYTGFLQTTDFDNKTFDIITMYHVFEHLLTPNEDLEKIKQIIKQNGRLVISMPNIDSWQAKLFKDNWFHLDIPRHLVFFKPKDFKKVMKEKGFVIEDERCISWEQNPYGYIQSSLNVFSKQNSFLYEFLKTNEKKCYKKYDLFRISLHVLFAVITLPLFLMLDVFESVFKKSATVEYTFKYQPEK